MTNSFGLKSATIWPKSTQKSAHNFFFSKSTTILAESAPFLEIFFNMTLLSIFIAFLLTNF